MVKRLQVKSNLKNYYVDLNVNFKKKLLSEFKRNDFLIIDKFIFFKYKLDITLKKNKKNILLVTAQEKSKEYSNLSKVIEFLIKNGFKKNSKIIAVGGGITQDIASFVSSIIFRGVEWIFFPTTLLAQADSCIGSKTSINFMHLKNQIGTNLQRQFFLIEME